MASFSARVSAASAWSSFHFDDDSKIGNYWASQQLAFAGGWGYGYSGDGTNNGSNIKPTIDLTQGCSSPGAIRFDIPSQSSANAAGSWTTKFKADDSIQVGPTGERSGAVQEVWVQIRAKWNTSLATTVFMQSAIAGGVDGAVQGGIKLFDISTGLPLSLAGSSSDTKQVIQTINNISGIPPSSRYPIEYYYGLNHNTKNCITADTFDAQNQRASPYCRYPNWYNCWNMPADEWVTLTLHYINLGRTVTPDATYCDFHSELYVQNDGQSRIKLVDWQPGVVGYEPSVYNDPALQQTISRFVVFPYMTYKDWSQVHAPGIAWYDELIIGPNDPGSADAVASNDWGGGGSPTSGVSPTTPPVIAPVRRSRFRRF